MRRRHGYTAGELFAQLAPEEFEQQGGMVAVALPSQAGAGSVTAEIFGRCGPALTIGSLPALLNPGSQACVWWQTVVTCR